MGFADPVWIPGVDVGKIHSVIFTLSAPALLWKSGNSREPDYAVRAVSTTQKLIFDDFVVFTILRIY
jgi:hypothetical protein